MFAIRSLGNKLFRKHSFILHIGDQTHKLFTPKGIVSRIVELKGNHAALRTPFWKDYVVKVKPLCYSLVMQKGKPFSVNNADAAESFVQQKLLHALNYPRKPFYTTFDFEKLKKLEQFGIEAGLLDKVEKTVGDIHLPVTSSHGDLHTGNIVYIRNELKIIDWSMFHENGSFLTDYIHFFNYRNAIANKESWTKAIIKDSPYMEALAEQCNITSRNLSLIYCLCRIAGELALLEKVENQKRRQIYKYNYILKHLTNGF